MNSIYIYIYDEIGQFETNCINQLSDNFVSGNSDIAKKSVSIKYWPILVLKIGSFILPQRRATSSGSNNLNSRPRPVQVMKFELAGSSRSATKNCHN